MGVLFEFIGNNWEWFLLLLILITALIITESQKTGKSVSPQQATNMVNRNNAIIVDIRDVKDFKQGHIAGALNIPISALDTRISELHKYKNQPIIVACKLGQQSTIVGKRLKADGFEEVLRLQGGMTEWQNMNLPVVR